MTVHGLDHFTLAMNGVEDAFVVIGGIAAALLLEAAGLDSRVTKDVDVVLIAKDIAPFAARLKSYVSGGGYEAAKRQDGGHVYYRFCKPKDGAYPKMIELFSTKPDALHLLDGQHVVPLVGRTEEGDGLSAILLEEEYVDFIKANTIIADNLRISNAPATMVLKARAFNDLTARKLSGDKSVDSKDITKHRNDIFALYQTLDAAAQQPLVGLPMSHMISFLDAMRRENEGSLRQTFKAKNIKTSPSEVLDFLAQYFGISSNP